MKTPEKHDSEFWSGFGIEVIFGIASTIILFYLYQGFLLL